MRQIFVIAALVVAFGAFVARYAEQSLPAPPPVVMAAVPEPVSGGRTVVVPRGSNGHFNVEARVDGKRIGFMVDTGASTIALTETSAARLGIRPNLRDYTVQVKTANGTARGARTELNRVEIDGVVVRNVAALIMPDEALGENLLGLSFLSKLRRFEYYNGKLVLEQ